MIKRTASDTTSADSVAFDVAFSDSVKNVDFRDFQLNLSGVTADPLEAADVTDASDINLKKTFQVTVRNVSGDGTLGLDIASSSEVADSAGNTLKPTSTEPEAYTIDNMAPSVALAFPEDGAFYNDATWLQEIKGTASESDVVSSLSRVQVAIRQNSTGKYWNGTDAFDSDTADSFPATGTTSWSFVFADELFPEDGEYTIETSAVDTAGNVGSTLSATLTRDTTAPTVVSVNSAASKPTSAAKVDYTVTFSEPVSGVGIGDFSLTHTQAGAGSSVQNVIGSGSTYTVTVAIGFRGGTLRLDVLDDDTIEDRAGNPLNDGFTTATLVRVGPLLLVAPYDRQLAEEAQRSWANHLGTSVTMTNSTGMKLVLIPPGEFLLGDQPSSNLVRITKPYYLQTTEVTQRQWESLTGTRSRFWARGTSNRAATRVSWDDAQDFCRHLSQKDEGTYRLPTEAEWEYACRAGTATAYSFGDDGSRLGEYAWFRGNASDIGDLYAHQVGLKKPNAFGLYDMHGNVFEWCHDWCDVYDDTNSARDDPMGPSSGLSRVIRGGSWMNLPQVCRSANRGRFSSNMQAPHVGFRVVRSPVR